MTHPDRKLVLINDRRQKDARGESLDREFLAALGYRVTVRRVKIDISQRALGKLLGVSSNSISRIERGYSSIPLHRLIPLCAILECSVHWLLTGEEEEATPWPTT